MNIANELIEVLVEFGGGKGGEPGNVAVRYLLPTFFWTTLAAVALREWRRKRNMRDLAIGIAALVGIGRELLMFIAEYGSLRGMVSFESIYRFYPPLEHLATMASVLIIAAAFLYYQLGWRRFSLNFFLVGETITLFLYGIISFFWPVFLVDHPRAPFGSFWGDMAFRITASLLLGFVVSVFIVARIRGKRIQSALLLGFLFLFLDEFLMILNLATQERYVEIYAPIRHNLHIWAIPLFLGVYWSEVKISLQKTTEDLLNERSRSESIISAMGDGISIQDVDFTVVYQNQVHKDLVGPRVGEYCYQAYAERQTPCEPCPVALTLADGMMHRIERTVTLSGMVRHLEITACPLRDASGRVIAGIEVVRPIDERKRLQEETVKSAKLESLGLLAGGLAHDFNNYLTSILGNIGLAMRSFEKDDDGLERLNDAEKATLRAAELTRRLLTFAKGGSPVKQSASLADVARDSVKFTLSGSNVRAEYVFPEDLSPVEIDTGQMSQVFNNLAINALHAMPAGGTLTVAARNIRVCDELPPLLAGEYVRVSVIDTGVGIPAEHLAKIFDPYFTTKQEGSGLGLSSVYSILRNHEGYITVESIPGSGTTFHLYVPVSQRPATASRVAPARRTQGQGRVLVMDDDPQIRQVVGHMLRSVGYECATAPDGKTAVEAYQSALAANDRFLAVIMDLTIPGGMGGEEAMRHLLAIDPKVKAFVTSGYSNNSVLSDFRSHGFTGVIAKPFSIDTLSSALRSVGAVGK